MASSSFRWPIIFLSLVGSLHAPRLAAQASTTGQTGMIHMPDARVEPEGVWRLGVSANDPYFAGWSSITLLPRVELSGRFTRIDNVPAFADGSGYGDHKDKAFDAKWLLRRESAYLPAIALGAQDFTGTRLFRARYVGFTKKFSELDFTVGYGEQRIDGWFGGLRFTPAWNTKLGIVLEHDANRYQADYRADLSGAANRKGGTTLGIEYRFGWLTTQLSSQDGLVSGQVYVSIPLAKREFIPKVDEPAPVRAEPATGGVRPDPARASAGATELVQSLHEQGFRDVIVSAQDGTLRLSITHPRISLMGRAVGRAARTVLQFDPREIRVLEITYTLFDAPILTYRFSDLDLLKRHLRDEISVYELEKTVEVRYASLEDAQQLRAGALAFDTGAMPPGELAAAPVSTRHDALYSGFSLMPFNVRVFFNDPSGVVHYDTFSTLNYEKRLAPGVFVNGAARLTLFEDVSDVTQPSNSNLPHVRTDVAEYRREGDRLRLESLLLNRYIQLHERVYTRLSAGYYEEMFGGVGGQVLYLPARGEWAADVSMDWLKQRRPGHSFSFRDYATLTALAAFHYRFPDHGVTTTARVGRFLARDEGVRMEVKRRFRSGVEIGAWYTVTNGDDVTGPGTLEEPYRDKGIFVSIPLNSMLTRDTQERAELALIDFTRDVGQMVESPGDLYRLFERRLLLHTSEYGALSGLMK